MPTRFLVREGTTAKYTATIKDEDDAAIPSATLDALTLTLYDVNTGTIINSRDGQNVLNANNVTVHATSGLITWTVVAADTPMVGSGSFEVHRALFEWTWATTKKGSHEVEIEVRNINLVP